MKAILDTNVLISAFNFPGSVPEDVLRLCLSHRIDLATSPVLLAEFGRILTDKFGWAADRTEQAVGLVARVAAVVTPLHPVRVVGTDPDDDRVLEAALEAGADVIVSGDKHLLRLKKWRNIRIVSPAALLDELEAR